MIISNEQTTVEFSFEASIRGGVKKNPVDDIEPFSKFVYNCDSVELVAGRAKQRLRTVCM